MKMRFLDTFTVVSLWIGKAKETFFEKVTSKCQQNAHKPNSFPTDPPVQRTPSRSRS